MTYHMGLTPRQEGWTNFINLELNRLRITTSINYSMFSETDAVRVQCDLSNPLKWDQLHEWTFNITLFRPSIFLLRDHVTLFTDVGADWTSQESDYATWIPCVYTLNLNLVDFSLFLNVNDGNIISAPAELNENSYIVFRGAKFSAKAIVPSDKISPMEHSVDFELQWPAVSMSVRTPQWNTLSILLSDSEIGQFRKLEVSGSYTYPSDTSRNNIETLDVQASASYCSIVFYGFLLRYLFNVRNNYLGDHTQFMTLEEYQREARLQRSTSLHGTGKRPPVSNVTDFFFDVNIKTGALILPSRLYEVSEAIRLHFDELRADVRFMDYYMDLQVNTTPISCYHHINEPLSQIFEGLDVTTPSMFVDGLAVHAHRLLGKPPSNPAYICNWDFDLGKITGESKLDFLLAINSAFDTFAYSLIDVENALPEISPPDRDISFIRLNAAGACLRIPVSDDEIRIQLGPTTVGADDRTSLLRSGRTTISLQSLSIQVLHKDKIVAYFNTAIRTTILTRRQDLLDHGPKQANHVKTHDEATRRAWFLYSKHRLHAEEDIETFEIDIPPFSPEHVSNVHRRKYSPKHAPRDDSRPIEDIHFAEGFLPPDSAGWGQPERAPRRPTTPAFDESEPMAHSSYSDIVLTHVDNLPKAQVTFIVEVSVDTSLSITPEIICAVETIYQALETTVPCGWGALMLGSG
jgi:protein CSF1